MHSRYSVMGLSLLGVTFSSTIISRCTFDFGHADMCGGSALQQWQNADDDGGDSAHVVMVVMVVMDLRAMVKVCAAVYLLIPHSSGTTI